MTLMDVNNQSSASIMLRSLMIFVTLLSLALGGAIAISTSHQLLTQVRTTSHYIVESLKKSDIDNDQDWQNWRRNSTMDTSASYVVVRQGQHPARHYYSPHTRRLLSAPPRLVWPTQHLYYRPNKGFFYQRTGRTGDVHYTLWLSLQSQVQLLMRIFATIGVLVLLVLFGAPFYITRLTRRLTGPLLRLSSGTKTVIAAPSLTDAQLPVPTSPTEVRVLASNFNDLLAQLSQRERAQQRFVMNATHELKTPIATIQSHAQLIERHAADHPEIVAKSVAYIAQESREMAALVDELLQLSRADQVVPSQRRLDLSQLVTELSQKLAVTFPQTIIAQVTPDLLVVGDAKGLEQILTNLVSNAAKYSAPSSTVTIQLTADTTGHVQLAVADEGPGIPPEDRDHVFDRFYRGANVRGQVAGTGLGLAIVAQLARLNHGALTLAGRHPHGTMITLTLPVAPQF